MRGALDGTPLLPMRSEPLTPCLIKLELNSQGIVMPVIDYLPLKTGKARSIVFNDTAESLHSSRRIGYLFSGILRNVLFKLVASAAKFSRKSWPTVNSLCCNLS